MDDTGTTTSRLAFGLAAVVLAAAAGVGLWRWQSDQPVQPIEVGGGDTTDIYPVWGDLGPLADLEPMTVRSVATPGDFSVLTVGRREGDTINGLVKVSLIAYGGPSDPATLGGTVLRLGDRDVADTTPPVLGEADLMVWLDTTVTAEQLAGVQQQLDASPAVTSVRYLDGAAMAAEFAANYPADANPANQLDAASLPTAFQAELDETRGAAIDVLTSELRGLPAVIEIAGADRYFQWVEAGALVQVDGGTGSEAVVAALHLTPDSSGLPRMSLDPLPDGLVPLDPPTGRWTGPLPSITAGPGDGTGIRLYASDSLGLSGRTTYQVVPVNGAEGYLTGVALEQQLAWQVPGTSLWFLLAATSVEPEQIRQMAEGITFTDQATWEARYIAADVAFAATTIAGGGPPQTTSPPTFDSTTTEGPPPGGFVPTEGFTTTTTGPP